MDIKDLIIHTIKKEVREAPNASDFREPLIGFIAANNPQFLELRRVAVPGHFLPGDLLPDARLVVSFFLPFKEWIVEVNSKDHGEVAYEWARSYVETNELIRKITSRLVRILDEYGIKAAFEPPTDNFDRTTLISRWSHKSVAVIAGLGSFGLNRMVITDSGCAGRFGSLIIDENLQIVTQEPKERCLFFYNGGCMECVSRCPVNAFSKDNTFNRQRCWQRCLEVASYYEYLGGPEVCGKCAIGPCSFESAV